MAGGTGSAPSPMDPSSAVPSSSSSSGRGNDSSARTERLRQQRPPKHLKSGRSTSQSSKMAPSGSAQRNAPDARESSAFGSPRPNSAALPLELGKRDVATSTSATSATGLERLRPSLATTVVFMAVVLVAACMSTSASEQGAEKNAAPSSPRSGGGASREASASPSFDPSSSSGASSRHTGAATSAGGGALQRPPPKPERAATSVKTVVVAGPVTIGGAVFQKPCTGGVDRVLGPLT
mmetsp:Transcript_58336/g.188935  ORF Transcript_58336/g.188935 Transcript_58336/m.188935 type:complete len:237 (+) Transcript_58336:1049-1759(+)